MPRYNLSRLWGLHAEAVAVPSVYFSTLARENVNIKYILYIYIDIRGEQEDMEVCSIFHGAVEPSIRVLIMSILKSI